MNIKFTMKFHLDGVDGTELDAILDEVVQEREFNATVDKGTVTVLTDYHDVREVVDYIKAVGKHRIKKRLDRTPSVSLGSADHPPFQF